MKLKLFIRLIDEKEGVMLEKISYSEDEYTSILRHIELNFGQIVQLYSGTWAQPDAADKPLIDLDLCLVAPTPERNYYTFVTVGFGAFKMPTPKAYKNKKLARAELCFALAPDTDFTDKEMEDLWPVRIMNMLVYFAIQKNVWMAWGDTFFDGKQAFSPTTKQGSIILLSPGEENAQVCVLPDGDEVNFYCMLSLYQEELEYVKEYGTDHLIDRFVSNDEVLRDFKTIPIINDNRPNVCLDESLKQEQLKVAGVYYIGDVIDCAAWHKENIDENNLPVDEMQAYNHLAVFLKFAVENDLVSDGFIDKNDRLIEAVLYEEIDIDIREYIKVEYLGCLLFDMFNDKGFSFASYYYNKLTNRVEDELHSYTADIDNFAQDYYKDNWEYLPEQKRYAYLFIPYDDEYYKRVYKMIEKRFNDWKALYERKNKYIMS